MAGTRRRSAQSDKPISGADRVDAIFDALGYPPRRRMLLALNGHRLTVTELSAISGLSLPQASVHLKALRQSGLLIAERSWRDVHHSLQDPLLVELLRLVADIGGSEDVTLQRSQNAGVDV